MFGEGFRPSLLVRGEEKSDDVALFRGNGSGEARPRTCQEFWRCLSLDFAEGADETLSSALVDDSCLAEFTLLFEVKEVAEVRIPSGEGLCGLTLRVGTEPDMETLSTVICPRAFGPVVTTSIRNQTLPTTK